MTTRIPARALVRGRGSGPVLALDEPLSLWGGVDRETGRISDPHHPQLGATISGTILAMPSGRGSSSASSVLAEMIRMGTAPDGMVLSRTDPIIVLGALVATELYGRSMPVVVVDAGDFELLSVCGRAAIDADGVSLTD
jgi:hypothetical protein